MVRYTGGRLSNWGAMMLIAVGFSSLQGALAWNVFLAGAGAISLFCAAFYLVSLGLKDFAFRGAESLRARPGWARASRRRDSTLI